MFEMGSPLKVILPFRPLKLSDRPQYVAAKLPQLASHTLSKVISTLGANLEKQNVPMLALNIFVSMEKQNT